MKTGADFMGGIAAGAGNVVSRLFYGGYDLGQYGVSSLYDSVTGESTHNEYLSAIGTARYSRAELQQPMPYISMQRLKRIV